MVISVGNVKGGSGKSTIAVNLAIMSAERGHDTLLIDADPQGTASKFSVLRDESAWGAEYACVSAEGRGIQSVVRKFVDKFAVIIIDVGGRDAIGFRTAAVESDRLLTPTLPGQFDCWENEAVVNIVNEARVFNEKLEGFVVLNCTDTNPKVKMTDDAASLIQGLPGFKLVSARLGYRIAYRHAASEGMGISELPSKLRDLKAVSEMTAVYEEVFYGLKDNAKKL